MSVLNSESHYAQCGRRGKTKLHSCQDTCIALQQFFKYVLLYDENCLVSMDEEIVLCRTIYESSVMNATHIRSFAANTQDPVVFVVYSLFSLLVE